MERADVFPKYQSRDEGMRREDWEHILLFVCLLVYSQNAYNSQMWTKLNPGVQNSIQVSCVNGRDLNHRQLPPTVYVNRKLECRVEPVLKLRHFIMG